MKSWLSGSRFVWLTALFSAVRLASPAEPSTPNSVEAPAAPIPPSAEEQAALVEAEKLRKAGHPLLLVERVEAVAALTARFPERAALWSVLGELRAEAGMNEEARLALQRAVEKNPGSAEAWYWLGVVEKRLGNFGPAESALTRVVEVSASFTPAELEALPPHRTLNERAFCRVQLGNLAGAYEDWTSAIQVAPEKGFLYANALKAALMLQKPTEAESLFRQSLTAKEFDDRAALMWTDHLVKNKQLKQAFTAYAQAIAAAPNSAKLRFYHGATLKEAGRREEALAEYQKAVTLARAAGDQSTLNTAEKAIFALQDPEQLEKLVELERLLQRDDLQAPKQQTKLREAITTMDAVLERYPDFWEPRLMRGVAHRRLGNLELADADFARVLEVAPEQPNALLNRGLVAQEIGQFPTALEFARKALDTAPNDPLIVSNGILILINAKECEEAGKRLNQLGGVLPKEMVEVIQAGLESGC
ncbi:MAG: tetratricopeptide repeat protein [Candidatus Sumerlaeia bacterium]|nr:tetratricopeptide repeat protein [Candidatus Sumerlaeia bacterium]